MNRPFFIWVIDWLDGTRVFLGLRSWLKRPDSFGGRHSQILLRPRTLAFLLLFLFFLVFLLVLFGGLALLLWGSTFLAAALNFAATHLYVVVIKHVLVAFQKVEIRQLILGSLLREFIGLRALVCSLLVTCIDSVLLRALLDGQQLSRLEVLLLKSPPVSGSQGRVNIIIVPIGVVAIWLTETTNSLLVVRVPC